MTDDIPDVPAMVGQIYEYLEKENTRGTGFKVQDKSIVIKLPNPVESCYATDEGRLPIFLAVSDCIHIFAAWQYNYLKSSFFYVQYRLGQFASTSMQVYSEHSKRANKLPIVSTSCGQA